MATVNEQTTTTSEDTSVEEAKKTNNQDEINKALRLKYEREMQIYEEQSNDILDGVRAKGVSVTTTDEKKKLPEQITDIHILFSTQKPEFVFEGIDTSDDLEKELNGTLEEKIKEAQNKKKDEDTDETE